MTVGVPGSVSSDAAVGVRELPEGRIPPDRSRAVKSCCEAGSVFRIEAKAGGRILCATTNGLPPSGCGLA